MMMRTYKFLQRYGYIFFAFVLFIVMPKITFAATCRGGLTDLEDAARLPGCVIVKIVIPALISIEMMIFVYNIVRYIANSANESERERGNKTLGWIILALFCTFAVWGIIGVLQNTTGIGAGGNLNPPQLEEGP